MGEFIRSYLRQRFINCQSHTSFFGSDSSPFPCVLVSSGCYMKGEEERFFFLPEVPSLEGETTEHIDSGWHHVCQESSLTPVRTPIAICLPHLTSKTSWFGSKKPWKKVYNRQSFTLAVFAAAVSGSVPRKWAARTAVSSIALKTGSHEKAVSSFSARKSLAITSF